MSQEFYSMFGNPAASFQEQLFRDLQNINSAKNKDVIYVIYGKKGDCHELYDVVKNEKFSNDDTFRCKIRADHPFSRIANSQNDHDYVMAYLYAVPKNKEKEVDAELTMIAISGLNVDKYYMSNLKKIEIENLRKDYV